jgi:hypothetical protein
MFRTHGALEIGVAEPHSLGVSRFACLLLMFFLASGCVDRDQAPVAAFEAFFAATASRDLPGLRALLCPAERRVLADIDDAELLRAFSVVKVLQRATLESRNDAAAVVIATDALGQNTRVQLRADLHSAGGWCIAGPAAPPEVKP